jgi:hypothetical protein
MNTHSQDSTISVTVNLKPVRDDELYDAVAVACEGIELGDRHFVLKRMLRIAIRNGAVQEIQASRLRLEPSANPSIHPKAPARHKSVPSAETTASKVARQETAKELGEATDDDAMREMMKENPPFS